MDASVYVGALSEELKKKSIPLSGHLRARYGKEFKDALSKDVPEEDLYRAISRIGERWEEQQLTLSQAMRDVRGQHRNGVGRTDGDRKRAADERIRQLLDVHLIDGDPRRPLDKAEQKRAKTIDSELLSLRSIHDEEAV